MAVEQTNSSQINAFAEDDHGLEATPSTSVADSQKLARELGLEYRPLLGEISPPRDVRFTDFQRLIGSWGKQYKIIPISGDDKEIVVAIADPLRTDAVDVLSLCYGRPIKLVVAPEPEITRAINSVRTSLMSDRNSSLATESSAPEEISTSLKIDVTDAEDEDAPIIRYVNTLIFRAANQRASDIHVEPYEDILKVRFRIDGVLYDVDTEAKSFQASILSRIKVMANLDIAEKRLPQDGRIGLRIAGQDVDIRVSTVPTRYGERIVMRLLDKGRTQIGLETLGLNTDNNEAIQRIVQKSHGIFLVTGPTGSGKTTTLYTALSLINSEDKNILTIEDPIEYELRGVGQMQVNPKIDFTFSSGLRSILRQDPDVIMVGEIRDLETVEIAVQASLTGHLVFSTLHTNDAPGAITRLLDMGVEPFLISSSLIAVMAQRLVRQLCSDCKVPIQLTREQLKEIHITPEEAARGTIFGPRDGGCPLCQHKGYRGRTGIHEMLMIDEHVRGKIMQRADASQIRQASSTLLSLRADAAQKILKGVTSFEEVLRVTQEDSFE